MIKTFENDLGLEKILERKHIIMLRLAEKTIKYSLRKTKQLMEAWWEQELNGWDKDNYFTRFYIWKTKTLYIKQQNKMEQTYLIKIIFQVQKNILQINYTQKDFLEKLIWKHFQNLKFPG